MADEEIFTTSGSSGEPKTVVRKACEMEKDAANLAAVFAESFASADSIATTASDTHFYGRLWLGYLPRFAAFAAPAERISSVEELCAVAEKGRVLFITTPSFLEKALSHPDFKTLKGRVADIVVSGGMLREETADGTASATGVTPLEIYGSTEAGTIASRRRSDSPCFTLVRGVEAVADGAGRLVVDSPYAMSRPLRMADAVRFSSARSFELRGRTDRLVKVLESFVSLDTVEKALEAHPLVARAAAATIGTGGVERIAALAVLSSEGVSRLAAGTFGEILSCLRADLSKRLSKAEMPRRIRFVREIPVDSRGKTPRSLVEAVLRGNCREPAVLGWRATAERLDAELVFPPDGEWFAGHFPGIPVLPGVAQLFFIRYFSKRAFMDFPEKPVLKFVKFRRIVRPGEHVSLCVERTAPGRFSYRMSVGGAVSASGVVEDGA